jgi:Cft2 family RNA processing exonuclease
MDGESRDDDVAQAPPDKQALFTDKVDGGTGGVTALVRLLDELNPARVAITELNSTTVPQTVLAIPVRLAAEEVVAHLKVCRKPKCDQLPLAFRKFKNGRPDAVLSEMALVYRTLWADGSHPLFEHVKKDVLKRHAQAAAVVSPDLNSELLPSELLGKLGKEPARVLAAVIWARNFNLPDAEALFKLCIHAVSATGSVSAGRAQGQGKSTSDDKVKQLDRARREAERRVAEMQKRTADAEKLAAKTQSQLADEKTIRAAASKKLAETENLLKAAHSQLARQEEDAKKESRIRNDLRAELKYLRVQRSDLEAQGSDLTFALAAESRTVERLERALSLVLRGGDAAWDFLQHENKQLEAEVLVAQGNDKRLAAEEWEKHRHLVNLFKERYPRYSEPRRAKLRSSVPITFKSLGGGREVGRSCYLLTIGDQRLLIDCGIKAGGGVDWTPNLDTLERPDAVIITHAHVDHVGWLPALIRKYPDLNIYCSDGTAAILPAVLDDCYQHYTRELARQRLFAQHSASRQPIEEAYDSTDVELVSKLLRTCTFEEEEYLKGGICLQFFRAGHVLGAASVLIEDESGRRVFISGDFASFDQLTVGAADWPTDLGEIDLLILESTYGGRTHSSFEEARAKLAFFLTETITRQGSAILASFALGRAQELLKFIANAQAVGSIPPVPVFVDGMIKRMNRVYRRQIGPEFISNDFREVSGEERNDVTALAHKEPILIVTTSGMLNGGPVVHYAQKLLGDAKHRIVLTGYQDEGAPSKQLKELTAASRQRHVTLEGEEGKPVSFDAAMPAYEAKLSSHADEPGLLSYSTRMRPRNIVLVHGDENAQLALMFGLKVRHPRAEIHLGSTEFEMS